jgi:hypothetical protein
MYVCWMSNDGAEVRRVPADDPIVLGRAFDYTDAFVVDLPEPDDRPPAEWVREGLAAMPKWVERGARAIGVQPVKDPPPGQLDVFRIVSTDDDVVHLEKALPLLHVDFIGRNVGPRRRMITTGLTYRRPLLATIVWTIIGPGHRWGARRMLARMLPASAPTPR